MDDLTLPLFTSDLEESNGKATYEFGSIDRSKHSGEIYYTPVDTSDGWWQFDSPSYAVDGETASCKICNPVIADTGTSLIYLDAGMLRLCLDSTIADKTHQISWTPTMPT